MLKVNFHNITRISNDKLIFVVVMARYKNKWILVRHKKRNTWEIPGGHIEANESADDAAYRELYEETGSMNIKLYPVSIYSVNDNEKETYGKLYFAEVNELGELPMSEIEEINLVDYLPKQLTYPLIQPFLFEKVVDYIRVYKL